MSADDHAALSLYKTPAVGYPTTQSSRRMATICDTFEIWGYRSVSAALRHCGPLVNGEVRGLMREDDSQHKRRTHSNHACLIFPDHARDIVRTGQNRLGCG